MYEVDYRRTKIENALLMSNMMKVLLMTKISSSLIEYLVFLINSTDSQYIIIYTLNKHSSEKMKLWKSDNDRK